MDELMNNKCIDFRKLLIIKAKSLKISDQECYLLLLIMTLQEIGVRPITPSRLSEFCYLSLQRIDASLISLLDKNIISRKGGELNLSPLYNLLLNQKVQKEKQVDLVSIFENAFGRTFSSIEIQILQEMKTHGYDDKMILDALNEAVKSGVLNFKYIEKILDNWSKYGVKRRFAHTPPKQQQEDIDKSIKDYEWWKDKDDDED